MLVSGAAVAQAQTAVTRQITSEPVETVVTQGPNGTTVTRRILTPEPGVSYATPPLAYPPVAAQALAPQYVEPAAPAVAVRTARAAAPAPARARSATSRHVAERPAVRTAVTPAAVAPAAVTAPADRALVLSPAQRQTIYRTVVQRDVYPAPQTDTYAPPVSGYPLRTVYPADEAYNPDYRGYGYSPDPYRDQDYRDPYHTAYRWDGVPLVVGARIPPSVPLVAVPEPVAVRVPSAQPYSYAVLDNRVYLVDPSTNIIVAEINR